ncbi:alginate lyase family protein [Daejeonella lutea]|nr:alginate lyase family protein [Daejeonella lutea]
MTRNLYDFQPDHSEAERIIAGEIFMFNSFHVNLGNNYDWITNPGNQYKYDKNLHWSDVEDFGSESGDIKYVWEKSRFSWIYEIIRSDKGLGTDRSEFIFSEIMSWIEQNPINSGPNYKCSQEISIRVLNWVFCLNFYRHSKSLTEERFQKIMNVIYWQMRHVHANIMFSRIAVRNNHAITETLMLYLSGVFFPFFPEAQKWKREGMKWFEQEIEYQIYPDGTFLQFSMNYHRVVIQLLTWAFVIAEKTGDSFQEVVYERAYKSLKFLFDCQDLKSGNLPNYGANDGALFFKLNSGDYRDYRPQLNALHFILTGASLYGQGPFEEDLFWYQTRNIKTFPALAHKYGWRCYPDGGYYILREQETLTFIRCGNHKDRPSQADNLHLDLFHKGVNIMRDSGTYQYNAQPEDVKYFFGSAGHNTVMLDEYDQMKKGRRFIWYYWSQAGQVIVEEDDLTYSFSGSISAFRFLRPGIRHFRTVVKQKSKPEWIVHDRVKNKPDSVMMRQMWHPADASLIKITSLTDIKVERRSSAGWYSSKYGNKEATEDITLEVSCSEISTMLTAT